MSTKFSSKTKYFLKLVLPFVLFIQWTMPAMEIKSNIVINFSDITFVKCNDPEHSHPPLSQRDRAETPEKLVNTELNSSFVFNGSQKYFEIAFEVISIEPETLPKFLLKHFTPSRGPPFFEV